MEYTHVDEEPSSSLGKMNSSVSKRGKAARTSTSTSTSTTSKKGSRSTSTIGYELSKPSAKRKSSKMSKKKSSSSKLLLTSDMKKPAVAAAAAVVVVKSTKEMIKKVPKPKLKKHRTSSAGTEKQMNTKKSTTGHNTTLVKRKVNNNVAVTVQRMKSTQHPSKSLKELRWERMIRMLRSFQRDKGYSLVTIRDDAMYPGLYQWTLSIRRNYRYQTQQHHQHEQQQSSSPTSLSASSSDDEQSLQGLNTTTTTTTTRTMSTSSKRPRLSKHKIQQLNDCNFPWDVQDIIWKRRYQELQQFYIQNGHCNVPLNYSNKNNNNNKKNESTSIHTGVGLGVWVQNQRSEYKKYRLDVRRKATTQLPVQLKGDSNKVWKTKDRKERTLEPSLSRLTPERIELLERLNFQGFRSHDETWNGRYQQLKLFYEKYNHSNVPTVQVFSNEYAALGMWCNNQRTAYRLFHTGNSGGGGMNMDRINKLEQLEFQWHYRKSQWYIRLHRLKEYYKQHGHVSIPTDDEENRDLRLWLIIQRYHYNCLQINSHDSTINDKNTSGSRIDYDVTGTISTYKSPLTKERISAIEEAVPNFRWKGRGTIDNGPSSEDWANLFDAMRDRGIQPGMKPKQHWFQGMNPFATTSITPVKDRYTEQDLLELWYQEQDEDDEDNLHLEKRLAASKLKTFVYETTEQQTGWSVTGGKQNLSPVMKNAARNYVEWQPDNPSSDKRKKKKKTHNTNMNSNQQQSFTADSSEVMAFDSLLIGNTEQVVRQRRSYSDLLKDEDEYDPDMDPILLGKRN